MVSSKEISKVEEGGPTDVRDLWVKLYSTGTVLWAVLSLVLLVRPVIDSVKSIQNSIRAQSNLHSYIASKHRIL